LSARGLAVDEGRVRRALFPSFAVVKPAAVERPAPPPPRPVTRLEPRLAEPHEALEEVRERARSEGFQAGLAQGRAAAQAEWRDRIAALAGHMEAAARTLLAARVELAAEVDRQLPRTLMLLLRKILDRELAASDTVARTVLRQVTSRLAGGERPMTLRLAPAVAEAFAVLEAAPEADEGARPSVRVEADGALGPGDWVLETHDGFLDGRVESQIEKAWQLLTELGR
jgi:flagellar assembly protein FliH